MEERGERISWKDAMGIAESFLLVPRLYDNKLG